MTRLEKKCKKAFGNHPFAQRIAAALVCSELHLLARRMRRYRKGVEWTCHTFRNGFICACDNILAEIERMGK